MPFHPGQKPWAQSIPCPPGCSSEPRPWPWREPRGHRDGDTGLGDPALVWKVPPQVQTEPIHSFSFYLLCGRSLLMTPWVTTFVHRALKLQWKPVQITGGNNTSRRENAVNWQPNVIIHFAACVRDGCEHKVGDVIILPGDEAAVWSPLEPGELRLYWKDKSYMILERERG